MISYVIRHYHAGKQKSQAIASLEQVIVALGLDIPIPEAGGLPVQQVQKSLYEAVVIHGKSSVSAVIHTYDRPALELDLPWMTISESDDRWESENWY